MSDAGASSRCEKQNSTAEFAWHRRLAEPRKFTPAAPAGTGSKRAPASVPVDDVEKELIHISFNEIKSRDIARSYPLLKQLVEAKAETWRSLVSVVLTRRASKPRIGGYSLNTKTLDSRPPSPIT